MLSFETFPLRLENPTLFRPNSPLHIGAVEHPAALCDDYSGEAS